MNNKVTQKQKNKNFIFLQFKSNLEEGAKEQQIWQTSEQRSAETEYQLTINHSRFQLF